MSNFSHQRLPEMKRPEPRQGVDAGRKRRREPYYFPSADPLAVSSWVVTARAIQSDPFSPSSSEPSHRRRDCGNGNGLPAGPPQTPCHRRIVVSVSSAGTQATTDNFKRSARQRRPSPESRGQGENLAMQELPLSRVDRSNGNAPKWAERNPQEDSLGTSRVPQRIRRSSAFPSPRAWRRSATLSGL